MDISVNINYIYVNMEAKVLIVVKDIIHMEGRIEYARRRSNGEWDMIRQAHLPDFTMVVNKKPWKCVGPNTEMARLLYNIPVEVFK